MEFQLLLLSSTALLLTIFTGQLRGCTYPPEENTVQCEPITAPMCRSVGYPNTSFPNVFGHESQDEAINWLESSGYNYLIFSGCSNLTEQFLCSAAFPLCVDKHFSSIGPCRELCHAVRESCLDTLDMVGFGWPPDLECSQFVPFGSEICIWNSASCGESTATPALSSDTPDPNEGTADVESNSITRGPNCSGLLVRYNNNSGIKFGGLDNCGEPCQGVYFEQKEQDFAVIWITAWSLPCLLISVVIFLTYILNFTKIQTVEYPIYYIALCYGFASLSYTISVTVGRDALICDNEFTNENNQSALASDGLEIPLCAVIFSLLYYFTLCTWMWWAVLTIQWFLCSLKSTCITVKWKVCFHITGWGVPFVFLLSALLTGNVSGEPALRTCWISKHSELSFLVFPLLVMVVLCSIIIMVCFARIVHLQRHSKHSNVERTNVVRLSMLIRVGVYCTVYLMPMGLLLCLYWYDYWFRDEWESDYVECQRTNSEQDCTGNQGPLFPAFMIRFAASLIMGVLPILWIMSKSSLSAWKKLFCVCNATIPTTTHSDILAESNALPGRFTFKETTV